MYTSRGNSTGFSDLDIPCRDYVRNVCRRGDRCKFRHPSAEECDRIRKSEKVFCHDFQNSTCRRINCKFIHVTREAETIFRLTGQLPTELEASRDNSDPGELPPICKDFTNGVCSRGFNCKYRHIKQSRDCISNTNFSSDLSGVKTASTMDVTLTLPSNTSQPRPQSESYILSSTQISTPILGVPTAIASHDQVHLSQTHVAGTSLLQSTVNDTYPTVANPNPVVGLVNPPYHPSNVHALYTPTANLHATYSSLVTVASASQSAPMATSSVLAVVAEPSHPHSGVLHHQHQTAVAAAATGQTTTYLIPSSSAAIQQPQPHHLLTTSTPSVSTATLLTFPLSQFTCAVTSANTILHQQAASVAGTMAQHHTVGYLTQPHLSVLPTIPSGQHQTYKTDSNSVSINISSPQSNVRIAQSDQTTSLKSTAISSSSTDSPTESPPAITFSTDSTSHDTQRSSPGLLEAVRSGRVAATITSSSIVKSISSTLPGRSPTPSPPPPPVKLDTPSVESDWVTTPATTSTTAVPNTTRSTSTSPATATAAYLEAILPMVEAARDSSSSVAAMLGELVVEKKVKLATTPSLNKHQSLDGSNFVDCKEGIAKFNTDEAVKVKQRSVELGEKIAASFYKPVPPKTSDEQQTNPSLKTGAGAANLSETASRISQLNNPPAIIKSNERTRFHKQPSVEDHNETATFSPGRDMLISAYRNQCQSSEKELNSPISDLQYRGSYPYPRHHRYHAMDDDDEPLDLMDEDYELYGEDDLESMDYIPRVRHSSRNRLTDSIGSAQSPDSYLMTTVDSRSIYKKSPASSSSHHRSSDSMRWLGKPRALVDGSSSALQGHPKKEHNPTVCDRSFHTDKQQTNQLPSQSNIGKSTSSSSLKNSSLKRSLSVDNIPSDTPSSLSDDLKRSASLPCCLSNDSFSTEPADEPTQKVKPSVAPHVPVSSIQAEFSHCSRDLVNEYESFANQSNNTSNTLKRGHVESIHSSKPSIPAKRKQSAMITQSPDSIITDDLSYRDECEDAFIESDFDEFDSSSSSRASSRSDLYRRPASIRCKQPSAVQSTKHRSQLTAFASQRVLRIENTRLRRRLASVSQQRSDLMAAYELLLEQNAYLRRSNKRASDKSEQQSLARAAVEAVAAAQSNATANHNGSLYVSSPAVSESSQLLAANLFPPTAVAVPSAITLQTQQPLTATAVQLPPVVSASNTLQNPVNSLPHNQNLPTYYPQQIPHTITPLSAAPLGAAANGISAPALPASSSLQVCHYPAVASSQPLFNSLPQQPPAPQPQSAPVSHSLVSMGPPSGGVTLLLSNQPPPPSTAFATPVVTITPSASGPTSCEGGQQDALIPMHAPPQPPNNQRLVTQLHPLQSIQLTAPTPNNTPNSAAVTNQHYLHSSLKR